MKSGVFSKDCSVERCDKCGAKIAPGTNAYLDMLLFKIFCPNCRTEGSKPILNPLPDTSNLERENAALKAELKQLKEDYDRLRKHVRELLEVKKKLGRRRGSPTLTEARLRLRGK